MTLIPVLTNSISSGIIKLHLQVAATSLQHTRHVAINSRVDSRPTLARFVSAIERVGKLLRDIGRAVACDANRWPM